MNFLRKFHCQNVWPPLAWNTVFFVVYGLFAGGIWTIRFRLGPTDAETLDQSQADDVSNMPLVAAAVIFALYRLFRFHPAANRYYAAWLRQTPWTPDKPLPLGPVHPVWQDVAVLAVLGAIAMWHAHRSPLMPAAAFGITCLTVMTIVLGFTRVWSAFVALGFLWPALMLCPVADWRLAALFSLITLVVAWGNDRCLRDFRRWGAPEVQNLNAVARGRSDLNIEIRIEGFGLDLAHLGWPYTMLSPKFRRRSISWRASFWLGTVLAWWVYCILVATDADPKPMLPLSCAMIGAAVRVVIYCSNVAPNTNIWGRIASGRIILPGFDRVFLTPLAAVLAGIAAGGFIPDAGVCHPMVEAISLGLILFILLAGGPGLEGWLLTAPLRFRPPSTGKAGNQRLRRV